MHSLVSSPRLSQVSGGAAIMLAVLVCYLGALDAGFIWDDDAHVVNDQNLKSLDGLRRIWLEPTSEQQYYPLVHTSFWLEYRVWELWPTGFHFSNIILHATNAILCWVILKRLKVSGAWVAAMIFALHPVHVESVAWISERKNVLSGVFYLSSLLAYLHYSPVEMSVQKRNWFRYSIALCLYCCALLSKSVTSTLPAAILLLVWWKRGYISKLDVIPILPMFILGVVAGLHTYNLELTSVGATGSDWDFSCLERLLIAGRAAWFYVGKLLWPHPLIFFYPRWSIDSTIWWQYLFPLFAVLLLSVLWRYRTVLGRGPLVGILFFGGTLVPALGFLNIYPMKYSFVADHFQYLASLGPTSLFVSGVRCGTQYLRLSQTRVCALTMSVLALLGLLTIRQCQDYQSAKTLYLNTISKNPEAWMAHVNIGIILASEDRLKDAARHFQAAVEIKPHDVKSHLNLGLAYERIGRTNEAIAAYETGVWLMSRNRDEGKELVEVHLRLGSALNSVGRFTEATPHLRTFLESNPADAEAKFQIGLSLLNTGNVETAIKYFNESSDSNPNSVQLLIHRGIAFGRAERLEEAATCFERAMMIDPMNLNVRYNLGKVLFDQGRFSEAVNHYRAVAEGAPRFTDAYRSLGLLYSNLKQYKEAVRQFEIVVSAAPDDPAGYLELGDALVSAGEEDAAQQVFEKALTLVDPLAALSKEIKSRILRIERQIDVQ